MLLLLVYEYTVGNHLMAAVGPGQIIYSTFVTQYSFMFVCSGPFKRNTVGYNNTRELLCTIITRTRIIQVQRCLLTNFIELLLQLIEAKIKMSLS